MSTFHINVPPIKVTISQLSDILTTAVEGGSHYWLAAEDIKREKDGSVYLITKPFDVETSRSFDMSNFQPFFFPRNIDLSVILKGLQIACDQHDKYSKLVSRIMLLSLDSADFDAGDCDLILQLGFFGDVVYG